MHGGVQFWIEFRDCLHETLRILDSAKGIFEIYSASHKGAYCILYYIVLYLVSRVKPFLKVSI